jgi:hypothetical protein
MAAVAAGRTSGVSRIDEAVARLIAVHPVTILRAILSPNPRQARERHDAVFDLTRIARPVRHRARGCGTQPLGTAFACRKFIDRRG